MTKQSDKKIILNNASVADRDETIAGVKTFTDPPVISDNSGISGIAHDSGNETIAGVKTFTDPPVISDNSGISGIAHDSGNETIAGVKTFTNPPVMSGVSVSGVVKTTGNESISGVKTFSTGANAATLAASSNIIVAGRSVKSNSSLVENGANFTLGTVSGAVNRIVSSSLILSFTPQSTSSKILVFYTCTFNHSALSSDLIDASPCFVQSNGTTVIRRLTIESPQHNLPTGQFWVPWSTDAIAARASDNNVYVNFAYGSSVGASGTIIFQYHAATFVEVF